MFVTVSLPLSAAGGRQHRGDWNHEEARRNDQRRGNRSVHELISRDAKAALTGDGSIMLTASNSLTARVGGSFTAIVKGPTSIAGEVPASRRFGALDLPPRM